MFRFTIAASKEWCQVRDSSRGLFKYVIQSIIQLKANTHRIAEVLQDHP